MEKVKKSVLSIPILFEKVSDVDSQKLKYI